MLNKTNLVIVAAPLPPDFEGTPQEFFEALVERMDIQSPSGTNFFVVGDVEPSSDSGPWLKDGDRWYVYSSVEGGYVPINIDDSITALFVVSSTEPDAPTESSDPTLWLRTSGSRAVSWYGWDGLVWRPFNGVPASGPTADRPATPFALEQYFDTDINALIHYERGAWRTVSGTPGDIKAVTATTASVAITANPGWSVLGEADADYLGKVLGVATKDSGGAPVKVLPPPSGISVRVAGDSAGEETHVLTTLEHEQHTHLIGHATALNSGNDVQFHRVDDGETIAIPPTVPPNYFEVLGDGSTNGTHTGTAGTGPAGTMLITSRQLSLATAPQYTAAAVGHNNVQPTKFLWHLVKD
jgi:hypothetical protein